MIPRIIHQIHCGRPRTPVEEAWIRSIGFEHLGWSHIVWDEDMLRALHFDVGRDFDELGNWASVSNAYRLMILRKFGGVYLDTDVEALDSLERLPLDTYRNFAAEQDRGRICNAVMGCEPNSEWVAWQLLHWKDFDPRDPASGVYLATAAPREELTLLPQHYVYPWMYDDPPEKRVPHPDSLLAHHWSGSWTK